MLSRQLIQISTPSSSIIFSFTLQSNIRSLECFLVASPQSDATKSIRVLQWPALFMLGLRKGSLRAWSTITSGNWRMGMPGAEASFWGELSGMTPCMMSWELILYMSRVLPAVMATRLMFRTMILTLIIIITTILKNNGW